MAGCGPRGRPDDAGSHDHRERNQQRRSLGPPGDAARSAAGLVFFTDCESDKGAELAANPRVAAVLHWLVPAHRQVRVAGRVERVSEDEADQYWGTRAPAVRLSAAAWHQSRVVASRAVLQMQVQDRLRRHRGGADVPRPRHWGGFRVLPSRVEFWQESPDGLHDQIRYRQGGGGWMIERLSP